jgi:hypothetical protein
MMAHARDLLGRTQRVELELLDALPTIADGKPFQPLADPNDPTPLDRINRIHWHFAAHLHQLMHIHNNLEHLVRTGRAHVVPGLTQAPERSRPSSAQGGGEPPCISPPGS